MTLAEAVEQVFLIEITFRGGHRAVWPVDVYTSLPAEVLAGSSARLVSRADLIRERAQARRLP